MTPTQRILLYVIPAVLAVVAVVYYLVSGQKKKKAQ